MSKNIWIFIPFLALCLRFVSSKQQYFVCKNVEDVFTEGGSVETDPRYGIQQGPPGKMGPPGVSGLQGMPGNDGPPGTVDYHRIKEAINIEIDTYLDTIKSTIDELTRNLSILSSEMNCRHEGVLFRSGRCFTVPHLSSSRDMSYEQAVAACAKLGASLAEFDDQLQQQAVYDFVHGKLPSGSSYVDLFLGMKYNISTSNVLYRSGIEADQNQLQWYPTYPRSTSSYDYLFMEVKRDFSAKNGIFNHPRSYGAHGVICET